MSYSVTVFLSFAVYLTIIKAQLPDNSESTSILSIYIVIQLSYCILVLVVNSFLLRLHTEMNALKNVKYLKLLLNFIEKFVAGEIRLNLIHTRDDTTTSKMDVRLKMHPLKCMTPKTQ